MSDFEIVRDRSLGPVKPVENQFSAHDVAKLRGYEKLKKYINWKHQAKKLPFAGNNQYENNLSWVGDLFAVWEKPDSDDKTYQNFLSVWKKSLQNEGWNFEKAFPTEEDKTHLRVRIKRVIELNLKELN